MKAVERRRASSGVLAPLRFRHLSSLRRALSLLPGFQADLSGLQPSRITVLSWCHVFPGWHTSLVRAVSLECRNVRGFPVSDPELGPRFDGEEMNAMTRVPRTRSIFVAAVLLALLVAPIAGARTLSSQPAHPADGGWSGAIQHWVGALLGLSHPNHHRHPGTQVPNTKDTLQPSGGTCIDPTGGKPLPPWCSI